ncbi:hypothetical protein [Nonomuraea aurantiaca]|uniref:hypothetical protein n=1 Tax=Nonomuraea aurantiaca TaxID=2878562 RepID=UPI001CD99AD3|nr:hypothetical protein [Nonomuraea aurantiaca]MCA2221596.1 hypothetical protein [Nonomuraea aurantiaca]
MADHDRRLLVRRQPFAYGRHVVLQRRPLPAGRAPRLPATRQRRSGAPYLRLFGTVHNTPDGQALWPDFRRAATTDWLALLEQGLRGHHGAAAPALATTVLAVIRGLLMDTDATGDTARTDAAFTAFLDLLRAR